MEFQAATVDNSHDATRKIVSISF